MTRQIPCGFARVRTTRAGSDGALARKTVREVVG
jgi:hypothetical protein